MSHQVIWTKRTLQIFIEQANLSQLQQQIMRTRVAGWTRTKQSMQFHISMATLDRIIKRLKIKYDAVQQHDDRLPKRRQSAQELYMDTH